MVKACRLAVQGITVGSLTAIHSASVMALARTERTALRYPGMCFQASIERGVWLLLSVWCRLLTVYAMFRQNMMCSFCMQGLQGHSMTDQLSMFRPLLYKYSPLHTCGLSRKSF